jgi:hypothetical protein
MAETKPHVLFVCTRSTARKGPRHRAEEMARV